MGYKDERFNECPEACVECGNIAVLNKYGVCQKCWENSINSEIESWEETLD